MVVHEKNRETAVLTWAWIVFCLLRYQQGRLKECVPLIEQTEHLARRVDVRFALGWTNQLRGYLAMDAGQYSEAEQFFRQGIRVWEQVEPMGVIFGLGQLMENKLATKDFSGALSLFHQLVVFYQNSELEIFLAEVLENGALVLSELEKNALAATCLVFAEQYREEKKSVRFLIYHERIGRRKNELWQVLGEERFEAARREGLSLTKEAVLSLVIRGSQ